MVMTLPSAATKSNYKLLAGDAYHKSRQGKVLGIVLHITAGLEDLGMTGPDTSAEGTNKWALSSGVDASWHAIADTDTVVLCIPDWYTAWHAKGYNSNTAGIEISKKNTDWSKVSDKWKRATIRNTAKWCAAIVKKHKLPLKLNTQAQVDAAIKGGNKFGFTYHSYLSDQRSDPGKNFPIDMLFQYINEELKPLTPKPPTPVKDTDMPKIVQVTGKSPQYITNGTELFWLKDSKAKDNAQKVWGLPEAPVMVPNLNGLGVLVGDKPPA